MTGTLPEILTIKDTQLHFCQALMSLANALWTGPKIRPVQSIAQNPVNYPLTFLAIEEIAVFEALTTDVDISDNCDKWFINICISNISPMLIALRRD